MTLPLAEISTQVWLFAGAGVVSLVAFCALILAPAMGAYGRRWEKATAGLLSLFVLGALLLVGFVVGAFVFYNWDTISGWLG
jgi:hypothetical protein